MPDYDKRAPIATPRMRFRTRRLFAEYCRIHSVFLDYYDDDLG